MLKKLTIGILGISLFGCFSIAQAQQGIQVVPIGESIKPEAGSAKKKRAYRPPVVKAGTSFLVELGTALSSGLSQPGDVISLYAAEDVGARKRAAILRGAPGTGKVIEADKKAKKIVVTFDEIEGYNGESMGIGGTINLEAEKEQASAAVGERFTATTDERVVVKSRRRKKVEAEAPLMGFIEINGKGSSVDIKKGKAKGRVQMILEAPKGYTADDIQVETVRLIKVNSHELEMPVKPDAKDPKEGDKNKNGTSDWEMYFGSWDFVKNQPRGTNTIYVRGNLKNGQPFEASTRVQIDY